MLLTRMHRLCVRQCLRGAATRHLATSSTAAATQYPLVLPRMLQVAVQRPAEARAVAEDGNSTGLQLQFLGTSASVPTADRSVSCTALRLDGTTWLFDAGEGAQIALMRAGLRPSRIERIFLTHMHGDHCFGLPGLLCHIAHRCPPTREAIHIYGPAGVRRYLRTAMRMTASRVEARYCIHELLAMRDGVVPVASAPKQAGDTNIICKDGETTTTVYQNDRYTVTAGKLVHRVPCWGYVVHEHDSPGRLDVERLQRQYGMRPGPLFGDLKRGVPVTTGDGRVIHPSDVLGPGIPGRKVVLLGDTRDSRGIAAMARDADVLVHEATMSDELEAKAIACGHSTPRMAGRFARSIGAKVLVLSHFSTRYRYLDEAVPREENEIVIEDLVQQARRAFRSDAVVAARDHAVYVVPKREADHRAPRS